MIESSMRDLEVPTGYGNLGILDSKYNVECESGHRWFSPNPGGWVGRSCDRIIPSRDHGVRATICTSTLRQIPG